MVVVHRAFGMRFIIYVDDHAPAHVHVRGDGEAKVNLVGADGQPEIVLVAHVTKADQKRILREVRALQGVLLQRWSEIHDGPG